MLLVRTVAPTTKIVPIQDVKDHLRIDGGDDEYYLGTLIDAAGNVIEEMTGRAIRPQTWAMSLSSAGGQVALPILPVQSVSSIVYYDTDNAQQTAAVSDFYLFADEDKAWLEPKPNIVWPTVYSRPDAITITFVAGYSAVPADLRHAALILIETWYDNRGAHGNTGELPFAVSALVNLYKKRWFGG